MTTRRVRAVSAGDAVVAAAWIARELPVTADLAGALPSLLSHLIAREELMGNVVEDAGPRRRELAAFGFTCFLQDAVADEYLAAPHPHLELHLLDLARRGHRPFLSYDEIAKANSGDGLTLVPLMWLQHANSPDDPETHELLTECHRSFLSIHRGFRLRRIIKEAPAERAGIYLSGGFRQHCTLPAGTILSAGGTVATDRAIFQLTRADVEAAFPAVGAIGQLFPYRAPVCGLTRAEQAVAALACAHLTDLEITRELGTTDVAVAMRWRSIYARVEARAPHVLSSELPPLANVRGTEKRRRVLAFLADHPEELRPYAWG